MIVVFDTFEPQPLSVVAFVVPCLRCVRAFLSPYWVVFKVGEKEVG